MTARDRIRRRYRQFQVLGLSGLGVFLGSVAVMLVLVAVLPDGLPHSEVQRRVFWLVAVLIGGLALGLAVGLTGMVRLALASRCPWCGRHWSVMVGQTT